MTPAGARKHLCRAWIVAVVWAAITILGTVPFVLAGKRLAGLNPALMFASAWLLLPIAYGVYRESRVCALLLLLVAVLDLGVKMWLLGWSHGWFDLIPIYFFAAGAPAAFALHRGGVAEANLPRPPATR